MIPGTNLHQFDVWNDGYFAHLPLRYEDGVILNMAVERMPYEKFAEFLEEKCGNYFNVLYYRVPTVELEKGLIRVSDDKEVAMMFDIAELYGRLELYLDHLGMDMSKYECKADEVVDSLCKAKGPPRKRYCNEFSEDEMVNWAEMEVEYEGSCSHHPRSSDGEYTRSSGVSDMDGTSADGDVARTSVDGDVARTSVDGDVARNVNVDKGKEKVTVAEEECEYDSDSDFESDYDSDKSIDYLSPGEEELIELRKRIKANREKEPESMPEMMETNDENITPDENTVNHRSETFIEHDVFMANLMKRLQSPDENGIQHDPFICVETDVDRYPVYDESTHWRLRHPKVCCV